MIDVLIFLVICCFTCVIVAIVAKDKTAGKFFSFLSGIGLILCITVIVNIERKNNMPTALDVYQGKTTLEITYRDSIPVDSIVVFKPEFRK